MSKRLPDSRRDSIHSRLGGDSSSSQGSPPKPTNMQTQQHWPSMAAFPSPAPGNGGDARTYPQEQMDKMMAQRRAIQAHVVSLGPEKGQRFLQDYTQRLLQTQQQAWAQMTPRQRQACIQQQQQGQQQRAATAANPTTSSVANGQGGQWTRSEQQKQQQRPVNAASSTSMRGRDKNSRQYTPQEYAQHVANMRAYAQTQVYPGDQVLYQQQQQLKMATNPAHTLVDRNGRTLTPEQYEGLRRRADMRVQMAQTSPDGQAQLEQQRMSTMAMSPKHPMIDRNGLQWMQEEAQALHRQRAAMQSPISPTRIAQHRQQYQQYQCQQAQGGQSVPTPTLTMDSEYLPQHMSFSPTQQWENSPQGSSAFSPRNLDSNAPDIAQMYSPNRNSQNHANEHYLSPSSAHSQGTNGYQLSNGHLSQVPQAGSPTFSPNMPSLGPSNSLLWPPSQHMDPPQLNDFAIPQSPGLFQGQQTEGSIVRTPTRLSASLPPQLLGSKGQYLQSPVQNAFSRSPPQLQDANSHQLNVKDMKVKARANPLKPHSQLNQKIHKVQKASGASNPQPKNGLSVDPRSATSSTAKVKSTASSVLKPPQPPVKLNLAQPKPAPKVVASKPVALQRMPTPKTAPPKPTAPQRIPTPTDQSSPASESFLIAEKKRSLPDGKDAYTEGPTPKAAMFSTAPPSRPASAPDFAEAQLQKHKVPGSKAEPPSRMTKEAMKHSVHTFKVTTESFIVDDAQVDESQNLGDATAASQSDAEGMMEDKKKAALDKMEAENNERLIQHSSSSQRLILGLPAKRTSNGQVKASTMCAPYDVIDLTGPEKPGLPISASPRIAASKANEVREAGQPTNDEPGVHRLHLSALQNGVHMDDLEHGLFIHEAMTSYIYTQKEIRFRRSMLDPPAEVLQQLAKSSTLSDAGWGNNMMDSAHAEALGLPVDFSMQPVLEKVRDPHYDGSKYSGNDGGLLPPAGVDPTCICTRDDDGSLRATDDPSMSEEAAALQYDLIEVHTEGGQVWSADERGRATWG